MGNHLKRQAGVAEARYKAGTLEIQSHPDHGFDIAALLTVVQDELGFTPIKRVDATLRGRIVKRGATTGIEIAGNPAPLRTDSSTRVGEGEQLLTGIITIVRDRSLAFKPR